DDLRRDHFALLTSGSTGRPRLVIGARPRAEELARLLHRVQDSAPVAETILALPLTYCYAFVNQWLWARVLGQRLVHTRGFSHADSLRAALRNAREAMICLVGIQVPLFAQGGESYPGVIRVHFAGGAFPQQQLEVMRRVFPNAEIFNNYGCAEAMPRLAVRRASDAEVASDIGLPLPGVELLTADNGELRFRSPYGAVAYVDSAGLHRITTDEWVPTGDLGVEEGGRWLLTGRANEVFKRHGEKVTLPLLLETVSAAWTGPAGFYRERDAAGEEGHVLVLAPRPSDDDVHAILQSFRAQHPRALWPLRIESAERLPTLPNGKLDRASLAGLDSKTVHWRQRIA
ncbi:MAG TPA: class I adenylate-forming enzyme family protein, partial [Thermoanaerobaculia bacterium]|nr:class I adenylate-forming enzyme family protein [Thermoanaerobaculia bacterium]